MGCCVWCPPCHIHECTPFQPERLQLWQFSFRGPMKHPSQFFEDEVLFILYHLRLVFLEDSHFDVDQSLLVGPWALSEVCYFCRGTTSRCWPLGSLGHYFTISRFLGCSGSPVDECLGSCLARPFIFWLLVHPYSFAFACWSPAYFEAVSPTFFPQVC